MDPITIKSGKKEAFVWDFRENLIKRIQVCLESQGEDSLSEQGAHVKNFMAKLNQLKKDNLKNRINLDKCTEGREVIELFKHDNVLVYATVRLSSQGTRTILIDQ